MKISKAGEVVVINLVFHSPFFPVCQQMRNFSLDMSTKDKIWRYKGGTVIQKSMKRGNTIFIVFKGLLALIDPMDLVKNGGIHEFLGIIDQTLIVSHISVPPI